MKRALLAVAGALLVAVAVTAWALEASDVASVTTQGSDGPRETHVWFAVDAGQLLLEAGTPNNPWYRDVLREPRLTLAAGAWSGEYEAEPLPNPAGHERVRRVLRERYGWRDAWVALLFDTEGSVAVALRPVQP